MEGKRTMPRDIKHGQSGKYILNLTRISKDLCVYQRNTTWYIRINKQPTWRDKFSCSLKTCDKEEAIRLAKEKYDELINEDKIRKQVRGMIFNEEDLILSTKQAAQGRIAEDKFKNLMMLKGYQVYAPVEDLSLIHI